jgi:SHS2 domain-containing protein
MRGMMADSPRPGRGSDGASVSYRWGEHVGELELHVEAATERGVFEDAALAFAELLSADARPAAETAPRRVSATGHDRAALLAAFLEELIFLAETERFVPRAIAELRLAGGALEAVVAGGRGEPPHLVKAVTHHRLAFEPADGGWRAKVLLDV